MVSPRVISQFHRQFKSVIFNQELKDLFKSFHGLYGLDQFPGKLLRIVKNFSRCDLIIHQKGQLNASIYSTFDEGKNIIKAKDFIDLHQQIKKGKKGHFNIQEELADNLQMTGYFTADIVLGSFFDAILIFTREEFFPPEKEEIKSIKEICKILPHFIEKLLQQQEIYEKNKELINFFNKHPSPLYIENQKGELLFSNEAHQSSTLSNPKFKLFKIEPFYIYFDLATVHSHTPEMFHQERVNLLGELLNTLRHELSNPLFGLSMSAEILKESMSNDHDLEPLVEGMIKSSKRCESILKNFSNLYSGSTQSDELPLEEIIFEARTLSKSATKGIRVDFKNNIKDSSSGYFYHTEVVQILFNLIINSSQALTSTKSPLIQIALHQDESSFIINIQDNGPGIPNKSIDGLFKNFHTTKDEGTGLGLAISRNLARKMNGDLLHIPSSEGASFRLVLPKKVHG